MRVPGHTVRDGFQFPSNPTMIVGWDRDGDGEYPPYDRDDVAVLDGQRTLAWAITSPRKQSCIEIAHLTIRNYGYHERSGGAITITRAQGGDFRQERFIIRSNIIANTGQGLDIAADYAPTQLVADGNLYDPRAKFLWGSRQRRDALPFARWQAATAQDAPSRAAAPSFVDLAAGDLHLAEGNAIAVGAGIDITPITTTDFDGQPRSADRPVAGADVPAR